MVVAVGFLTVMQAQTAANLLEALRIEMVSVRAGSFEMGDVFFDDAPLHQVTLPVGFTMSRAPITNLAIEAYIRDREENTHGVLQYDPAGRGYVTSVSPKTWTSRTVFPNTHPHLRGVRRQNLVGEDFVEMVPASDRYTHLRGAEIFARPSHPAVMVSLFDALGFVAWLSAKTQISFRLPTEAQWEYAARAGRGRLFPFATATGRDLQGVHWSGESRQSTTADLWRSEIASNPWGLEDMTGNTLEWTESRYGPYPTGPIVDPLGPSEGEEWVIRGGSWGDGLKHFLRSGARLHIPPSSRQNYLSFRVVAPIWSSRGDRRPVPSTFVHASI